MNRAHKHVRRVAAAALAGLIGLTFAGTANAAEPNDCPMRDRPFSVDSTLLDILVSPSAKATVDRVSPNLLAGLPARLLSTKPPTQGNVLTPRTLMGLKRLNPNGIPALDAALRAVPVTAADRVARCARYDDDPLVVPPASGRPRLLVFEKITGFRDGPSVEAGQALLRDIAARRG